MKYAMSGLRMLPDRTLETFLKRYWKTDIFTFYSYFSPKSDGNNRLSGIIKNVKKPGEAMLLKYPGDGGYVNFVVPQTKKIERGYYKFDCHVLPLFLRKDKDKGGLLQLLLVSIVPISSEEYGEKPKTSHSFSQKNNSSYHHSKDIRRLKLEDNIHGWGKNIYPLIGAYIIEEGKYYLSDIRTGNYVKVRTYPKTTFKVGRLELNHPIDNATEGQFCTLYWKFSDNNKVNPLEIEVDGRLPIALINSKELITKLYNDSINNSSREKDQLGNSIETIKNQIAGQDPCTFIYELLQNASDYPYDETVDVEIHLTRITSYSDILERLSTIKMY